MITIYREVLSGNALAYRHWRVRHADKKAWLMLIRCSPELAKMKSALGPDARRSVIITAYRKRILDDDNLIAGCKHLRDSLIVLGLIVDDNAKWSEFTYRQETVPRGDRPRTTIQVENI